jgi:ElaA protein
MVVWQWRELTDFTTVQWYAIAAARSAVFVVEQTSIYLDLDGWDARATHLIAWEREEVAAYLRCFAPGVKWPEASLGRILTTQAYRGSGLGRELVARGLARIDESFPGSPVRIGAQSRLEKFYNSFGFVIASDPYIEDGIPHIEMLRAGAG